MNRLRTDIMNDIVSQVDTLARLSWACLPGNLTGFSSPVGQGSLLARAGAYPGDAGGAASNVFTDAGINQTYHRVMLDVTVDITLLIPGGTVNTSVNTQVCGGDRPGRRGAADISAAHARRMMGGKTLFLFRNPAAQYDKIWAS